MRPRDRRYVDGHPHDETLTYTGSKQWDDATVYWQGLLKRGTHTVWVQSNVANVWGCQWPNEMWGNLNVLVMPAMKGLQIRTCPLFLACSLFPANIYNYISRQNTVPQKYRKPLRITLQSIACCMAMCTPMISERWT